MLRVIETRLSCAADDAAFELALFRSLEDTGIGETLRFWEHQRPAVYIGRSGLVAREVHEEACRADGVPIVRRPSGGGAVVVGHGCLNYSLLLSLDARPELRHVRRSYRFILGLIARALALRELAVRGMSDLALNDRKVSGNAQWRGRRALLHHGTLLYDFDVRLLERYLREPTRQPEYRAGRRHTVFVTNVPLALQDIKARIADAWSCEWHYSGNSSRVGSGSQKLDTRPTT